MIPSGLRPQKLTLTNARMGSKASVGGRCSRRALNRHDVGTCAQPVKVVAPILHHLATLIEPLCAVVGIPNFVALRMRELEFDQIGMPSLSFNSVLAMVRNPCPVISSFEYPSRRKAVLRVLSLSGRSRLSNDGKT